MNKIFIYARPCVNKEFFHDDVSQLCFSSLFLSAQKRSRLVLEFSFVLANKTNSKGGEDVSQIMESE